MSSIISFSGSSPAQNPKITGLKTSEKLSNNTQPHFSGDQTRFSGKTEACGSTCKTYSCCGTPVKISLLLAALQLPLLALPFIGVPSILGTVFLGPPVIAVAMGLKNKMAQGAGNLKSRISNQ